MNSELLIKTALGNGVPDRVPSIPKIWVDLAANLTGQGLRGIIESPRKALSVIYEAGRELGVDAVRQFHFPPRDTIKEDGTVFEVKGQNKIGKIDMEGGLRTNLFDRSSFNIEDPYHMAFSHYWTAKKPFIDSLNDVKKMVVPKKKFYKEFGCKKRQKKIKERNNGEIALIGDCHSATLAFYEEMRGYDRALRDLIKRPELVHAIMEKGVEMAIERGKFNLDIGLNVLRLNDSIGNMSVISPETWREFVFPHMKTVCDALHDYDSRAKIYCHICGNVIPIVKDLVKTGLDCIGPLDPRGDFAPSDVRTIVGEGFTLYGGVDTLSFLRKQPKDIISEAKKCIYGAGQNGNYILGSGCVLPRDSKKDNVLALQKAARKWGKYDEGSLLRKDSF